MEDEEEDDEEEGAEDDEEEGAEDDEEEGLDEEALPDASAEIAASTFFWSSSTCFFKSLRLSIPSKALAPSFTRVHSE